MNTRNLRILTLNVAGLPAPISKKPEERLPKLAKLLSEKQNDYDVICLQELFDESLREIVVNTLLPNFPYQIARSTHHLPGVIDYVNWLENSGLFLASKVPITWKQFVPYKNATGPDKLAWKGVLGACLAYPGGKKVMIFTTHLQSDDGAHGAHAYRKEQLDDLIEFVQQQEYDHAVICGDFNISESNGLHYHDLVDKLSQIGGVDTWRSMYPDCNKDPGYTMDCDKNHNMMPGSNYQARLDYTFTCKVSDYDIKSISIWYPGDIKTKLLSDHFGVLTEIFIENPSDVTTHSQPIPFGLWSIRRIFPCIP